MHPEVFLPMKYPYSELYPELLRCLLHISSQLCQRIRSRGNLFRRSRLFLGGCRYRLRLLRGLAADIIDTVYSRGKQWYRTCPLPRTRYQNHCRPFQLLPRSQPMPLSQIQPELLLPTTSSFPSSFQFLLYSFSDRIHITKKSKAIPEKISRASLLSSMPCQIVYVKYTSI